MRRHFRLLAALAALAVALTTIGVALAAPPAGGQGRSKHEEVVAYWTPDRVARAKPRELIVDGRPNAVSPGKAPGSGGTKGSTSVTGASWTGGGLVKQTVGKVLFTMAEVDYVCSGTVVQDTRTDVSESLVLTAGHCVYDQTDGWAYNWMFMPDFDSAPAPYNGDSFDCTALWYGCWTANALVTSAGWSNGDFNEDYAFAVMGLGGKDETPAPLDATVGAQAIAFTGRPPTAYAFGYPQATPYDGTDLVYCSGSTVTDGWGGSTDSGLNCNMTGGSSGGGWFYPFDKATGVGTLVSVNSFKYLYGRYSKYMFGPRFDADTQNTYNEAQVATANTAR